jgi:hypothetical protein
MFKHHVLTVTRHGFACKYCGTTAATILDMAFDTNCTPDDGDRFLALLHEARNDRAARVNRNTERRGPSISHRAQDYGLVPHPPTKAMGPLGTCCAARIRDLATAASLLRYRNDHRDGIYGMTVTEEVRTARS